MKHNKNQTLLSSMVKSLIDNDATSASNDLHKYLTNKSHSLVEKCGMENEEELTFDVDMGDCSDGDEFVQQCCDMIKACGDPELIKRCCDELQRYCDEEGCDDDEMYDDEMYDDETSGDKGAY